MPKVTVESVKQEVQAFYTTNAIGSQAADAFCAWWLSRYWKLEQQLACAQAPAGSSDFGLDGFYIEPREAEGAAVLHLLQAKHSANHTLLKNSVKQFARTADLLAGILNGGELPTRYTSSIWQRLHAAIDRLRDANAHHPARLRLRFEVLHLSDAAPETVDKVLRGAKEEFDAAMLSVLPEYEVGLRAIFPPADLTPAENVRPRMTPHKVRFSGEVVSDSDSVRYYAGFGYLADLVDLYRSLGESLFSKNVRSYLYKAHEKGPAKHMRDSLNRACVQRNGSFKDSPERFAMLHNGVAVVAANARAENGELELFGPNVINGCQTVKNAALWLAERATRPGFSEESWWRVRIPIRVLVTHDEGLISDVTISNNRQNAIRASAFRANHPTQLELAENFRESLQIFYERQEGAFQNLQKTNPRQLEEWYSNSYGKPLKMEELAVAIAVASGRPALSVASKASELFEDSIYDAIFSSEKLRSLELLVFLRNLLVVLPLVIKDVAETDTAYSTISQGKFAYPSHRILARYVSQHREKLIDEYGQQVLHKFPKDDGLREAVRRLFTSPAHTNLRVRIKRHFLDADGRWKSATDAAATDAILRELGLEEVDVFA